MVKKLPAMRETRVRYLGQEESLEKGKATPSSVLAWRIPGTEEPGGLKSMGPQRVGHDLLNQSIISLFPLVTTNLFFIPVNLFLFC